MKKIIAAAALMLLTMGAKAQRDTGTICVRPVAGVSVSNLTDLDGNKTRVGVGLISGAEVSYTIHPVVDVEAGLLYAMQGAKWSAEVGECKMKLEYLNVPIMASAELVKGLRIRSGVQLGFLMKAKEKLSDVAEVDVKDETKKVDVSIPLGLSYEYMGIVFDARYNFGLTRVFKSEMGLKAKNSVFNFTIGYKFAI